jgi:glycosyltransferase involved in cell wall biosynthesis
MATFSHSFVIPSHNQGQFLAGTIESLLNQDEPSSEIVISEDHSADNSLEIAQSYAARYPGRIRLIRPPHRLGMFPNWNWAVAQTRSDWVSVIGSDDQALPNFVSTMREGVAKTPNVVVVGANWHFVDGNDNILFTDQMLSLPEIMHPPQTFYMQLFANRVHPAAHVFRRAAWEKVGGFPGEVKLYGDWAFWLKLTPLGDFVHMRRVIARYRINYRPGLEIARMNQNVQDEVTLRLDLIPRIARQFPKISQWRLNLASRRRFRHMLNHIARDLNGADPGEQVKIFEPWAHEIGPSAIRLLDRFARSEPVGLDWFDGNVVLPLRELYRTFQPAPPPPRPRPDGPIVPVELSIVVPIRSGEDAWAETLAAALDQDRACEVVAVVSRSGTTPADKLQADKLLAEVERAAGGRARIVCAPDTVEESAAAGLAAATGSWIAVARPGVKLGRGVSRSVQELAVQNPNAVALVAGPGFGGWAETFRHVVAESLQEPPLFAVAKSAWQAVGGYQPEVRALVDRALLLKLAFHGPCCGGFAAGSARAAAARHWDLLRDAEFLHRLLIPTLVARRGGIPRWEIERMSRRAFRAVAKACAVLEPADRARAAELVGDWARHLDETDLLEAVRAGRHVPANPLMSVVKRRVRAFYRALR